MKDNFVELWHGDILTDKSPEKKYWSLLTQEEKKRASKFSRQELRQKYINTRGLLRTILGLYTNTAPQNLVIKTTNYGKPFLENVNLHFNLSHTANLFAVIVSNVGDVGIDLEICRAGKNLSAIVEKCFSVAESLYWNALPDELKTKMFFRFWVRKEAFVKAVGRGIAMGLELCEIDTLNQNNFSSIPDCYGLASDWKILDIPFEEQAICAVVTKDLDFRYKKTRL